jgi:hypothetical protein
MNSLHVSKEYHCNKKTEQYLVRYPFFGPFPLKKSAKGVPKDVKKKQVPPNPVISMSNDSSSKKKYSCRV